ncbi:MAG: formyltransferase family protein [Aestuariibacter sp.]
MTNNKYSYASCGPGFDFKKALTLQFDIDAFCCDRDLKPLASQLLQTNQVEHRTLDEKLHMIVNGRCVQFDSHLKAIDRLLNLSRLGPNPISNHPEIQYLNPIEVCAQALIWLACFWNAASGKRPESRFLNNVFKALDSLDRDNIYQLRHTHGKIFPVLINTIISTIEEFSIHIKSVSERPRMEAPDKLPLNKPFTDFAPDKMQVLTGWVMIAHPSLRTIAYLNSFIEVGVFPEIIVWLGRENGGQSVAQCCAVTKETYLDWQQFGYEPFFSLLDNVQTNTLPCEQYYIADSNINTPDLQELLSKLGPELVVFTGGGIVSGKTFQASKSKWLHCHPGALPEFRGSTCFYYSYLNQKRLDCTVFYMSEQLDRGQSIDMPGFNINYPLKNNERMFIDQVLDPQIRRLALRRVLENRAAMELQESVENSAGNDSEHWPYYVIHPYLRALCADAIQASFNSDDTIGIHYGN